MKLKNIVILFMIVSFLTLSGCAGPAEDNGAEPAADGKASSDKIGSKETPADNLATLKDRLIAEGYVITFIEETGSTTTQGVPQKNLIIHVDTRDTARYELVSIAAIAYEYFPDKDMYTTQCDTKSSESSGGTTLRPSYYVEKGAIVAYINGALDKEDVKVR